MNDTGNEIASQPGLWVRSREHTGEAERALMVPGERMLLIGCGTSWFVAQCLAELREKAGFGETDAVCASEYTPRRHYDRVVAVTRSGTSTDVLDALRQVPVSTYTVAITAARGEPVDELTDSQLVLDFADERSVVQTRFPTTVLALARHAYGEDLEPVVADARKALGEPLPADPARIDHLVFLGTGWTVGLAHEAALKVREAAQARSESYPAGDFRHGPVAVAGRRSLVWSLGDVPPDLDDVARSAGATAYRNDWDPLAQLVLVQRFALAMAAHRGLDPDRPRLLTRSVVLNR
jgi:fructoselysine-6-P-deglycase FrlB-like protein